MSLQVLMAIFAGWGILSALGSTIFLIGRWTKGAEDSSTVALKLLAVDVKHLGEEIVAQGHRIGREIGELRGLLDGRFTELQAKQTADHQRLRELENWRHGLFADLAQKFYPIGERLTKIEERIERRDAGEWSGPDRRAHPRDTP